MEGVFEIAEGPPQLEERKKRCVCLRQLLNCILIIAVVLLCGIIACLGYVRLRHQKDSPGHNGEEEDSVCPPDPGNEIAPGWRCHALDPAFFDGYNCAVLELALQVACSVENSTSGKLVTVGEGCFGRVYALKDGRAMKVQRGDVMHEAILASALPETPTLARVQSIAKKVVSGDLFVGQVTHMISGYAGIMYPHLRRITSEQALQAAADLSIALHALHTKIWGYVVMHCDIHPSAKNVLIVESEPGMPWHAALVDYGASVVHKLQDNENPFGDIFQVPIYGCHATSWKRNEPAEEHGRFGVAADWRELGHAIYGLVADFSTLYKADDEDTCDRSCAAARNIGRAQMSPPLKKLVSYLVLRHQEIRDEVTDVLRHEAFLELSPQPADLAAKIQPVTPSQQFEQTYAPKGTTQLADGRLLLSYSSVQDGARLQIV